MDVKSARFQHGEVKRRMKMDAGAQKIVSRATTFCVGWLIRGNSCASKLALVKSENALKTV